jgi:hypothetical protein
MAHHQKGPPQKLSSAEFARLVTIGQLAARDRFGKPIDKDTLVLYRPENDVIYQVTDVRPIMDPRLPPGVKVTLKATVNLMMPVNVATPNIVTIGTVVPSSGQPDDATPPEPGPEAPPDENFEIGQAEGARLLGLELTDGDAEAQADRHDQTEGAPPDGPQD